ncbi:MAG: alpha/beta hydrolase [Phenylobacterium sp.]
MRRIAAALMGLALAAGASSGAAAAPLTVVSDTPALPPSISHLAVHSDRLNRDFELWVSVPSATVFLPGQKLPAIYALDSGYGIAGPQGTLLAATGAMAPAIIVSVGYKPTGVLFRNLDLTHNKFTAAPTMPPIGGGGAAFEAFLLEDLKPLIEAKYPADPNRAVLFGHSLGGLFAANVFADNPDAFAAYIIGSPSVWADPGVVARVAAAAPKAHGRRVYLTVGSDESAGAIGGDNRMVDGFQSLAAVLKNQPGVILKTQLYAGETHLSYYPRLVTDGFPYVLPPARKLVARQVKLPDATLARYVGVYRMPDGRKITVTSDPRGQLMGQVTGLAPNPLQQNGPDRFYAPVADINVQFDATGVTLTGVDGGKLRADREAAAPTPAS